MEGTDPEFTRALNAAITVALSVVSLCVLLVVSTKSSSLARADRFSIRVRLPYGSERTRESVARALRARAIASAVALMVGALASVLLLSTPLATSPLFIWYTMITTLVAAGVVGALVVSVRERLFDPAPDAPRIARARAMRTADYIGPVRRGLPAVITGVAAVPLAIVATAAVRTPDRVDAGSAAAAGVFAVIAAASLTALPWLERLILAQPQPATNSLELAWDDALRTNTLMALRLECAIAAWFVLWFAVAALWIGSGGSSSGLATQVPTWGMLALTFAYPGTGRRLRAPLYPEWLRQPASTGGAA